jgi:hypothetical protein
VVGLDASSGEAVVLASLPNFLLLAEFVGEYIALAGLEADATDDAMTRPEMSRLLMSRLKDSSSTLARL